MTFYLSLFSLGSGLPQCTRQERPKYKAIFTCKPLKAFPITRDVRIKYKPFPKTILKTEHKLTVNKRENWETSFSREYSSILNLTSNLTKL